MNSETVDLTEILTKLEGLRLELSRLSQRVEALETARTATPLMAGPERAGAAENGPQGGAAARPPAQGVDGLSEEVVLVISAAIAGFLGKKAHIRGIRLVSSPAWAQQGRVTIQASHALSVHSVRSQP
jgi:methylmalonyl-CoA carboxyltransferase large subunit